jgi:vacuolar-type H+-ATPase subunit F/Vma7
MSRVVLVVPNDIAPGFRLAGAAVVGCEDALDAFDALGPLLDEDVGVVGLWEEWFDGASDAQRAALRALPRPVVVAVPSGAGERDATRRRARIAELLEEAVGLRVTFRPEEDEQ